MDSTVVETRGLGWRRRRVPGPRRAVPLGSRSRPDVSRTNPSIVTMAKPVFRYNAFGPNGFAPPRVRMGGTSGLFKAAVGRPAFSYKAVENRIRRPRLGVLQAFLGCVGPRVTAMNLPSPPSVIPAKAGSRVFVFSLSTWERAGVRAKAGVRRITAVPLGSRSRPDVSRTNPSIVRKPVFRYNVQETTLEALRRARLQMRLPW